ncbi:glutamate-1-semialdehyde 2,1-aminomutase, partial [Tremellales sp. Uapishka_1]
MTSLSLAVAQARADYVARNPKSFAAFDVAAGVLPGGGTRSSIFIHPFPLFIARGEGTILVDMDGHQYLDFVSDFTSGIYGKTNKILRDAIVGALDNGIQLGAHTPFESRLATLIRERFPSMELLRFANSGTEANLLAITTAIKHTARTKVVVFEGGYHGSLLSHFEVKKEWPNASLSKEGERKNEANVLTAPFDYIVAPYNDIASTRSLVEANADSIAAIIIEPMLGAGGCIPGHDEFLREVRRLATAVGAVMILDEVQTARLGFGGRQKVLGITPDLCTIGKFFGGGFAFGAFGGKEEIMQMFDSRTPGAVSHGGTFNNSPCTMVAGQLKTAGLDFVFFKLLEKGYWIAQRGLISLSFAMTQSEVDDFVQEVLNVVREAQSLTLA